ncbi:MAG: D-aminoacyl-tRNA deacylase [Flavobacteriaceae bacterium]|nr:D-aminoacyl-tRNA deacylase [Flavobacteriaceae bacterium]
MKVVIQRVKSASVQINQKLKSKIEMGFLVFIGICVDDTKSDAEWLVNKILNLRIFNDKQGVMNESLIDVNGEILIISQFTLMALTKKGNRPSYIRSASHKIAVPLYEHFVEMFKATINDNVKTGVFGADMEIKLVNDGPVTILIDTKNKE